jgi:hypothetical protein
VVPEAHLKPTEHGVEPAGEGWFVVNAQEAKWLIEPSVAIDKSVSGDKLRPGAKLTVPIAPEAMVVIHNDDCLWCQPLHDQPKHAVEGINTEYPPTRAAGQVVDGVALIRPVAVPWMRAYNLILLFIYEFGQQGSVAALKPGRAAFGILRAHKTENTRIM